MEKEKEILSLPLLHFGLLAHFLPRRPAGLPSLFLSSPPVFLPGPAQLGELATVAAAPSLLLSTTDGMGLLVGAVTHLPRVPHGQAATAAAPTSRCGSVFPRTLAFIKEPSPSPPSLLPPPLHSRIRPSTRKSQPQRRGPPSSLHLRLRFSPW